MRSEDGGATWSAIATDTQHGLRGVEFLDKNVGWTVGPGVILHTEDGGDSWIVQRRSDEMLEQVAFVNAEQGVAVGTAFPETTLFGERLVLVTRDRGQTWTRAPIDTRGRLLFGRKAVLRTACFTATGIGLVTGSGIDGASVLLSTDAGITWADVTERIAEADYSAGACVGDSDLWLAQVLFFGGGTRLIRSSDGGMTWVDASSGLPQGFDGRLNALAFVDRERGWAGGVRGTQTPIVLHTNDGGEAWEEQELPLRSGIVFGLAFTPSGAGAAVGQTGLAFVTTSGGRDWVNSVLPQALNEVAADLHFSDVEIIAD